MKTRRGGVLFAVVAFLLWSGVAAAQSSPYYITDGNGPTMWIVQNGAIQSTVPVFTDAYAIAVRNTVLLESFLEGGAREYTLAGAPTGNTFPGGGTYQQLLDGTTDGVQYNYTIAWDYSPGDGDPVLRYDLNWQTPTVLFSLPSPKHASSITYDTSTGHLFIAFDDDGVIREFNLAGNQLGSFDTGLGSVWITGLAYEAATDSLWFKINGGGTIYNFSKSGTQRAAIDVTGLAGHNDYGGEMRAQLPPGNVPTLSFGGLLAAITLLAAVGVVVLLGRR
jgi:hypothetical protein